MRLITCAFFAIVCLGVVGCGGDDKKPEQAKAGATPASTGATKPAATAAGTAKPAATDSGW